MACDFIISGLGNEDFKSNFTQWFEVKVERNGAIILVELLQTTSTKSQRQTLSFRNEFLITSHFGSVMIPMVKNDNSQLGLTNSPP